MTSLLLQHLITTTLLAALVWTVCGLAKPAPAAKHILWSVVMVKLLIPPMGELPVSVPATFIDKEPAISRTTTPPIQSAALTSDSEPTLAARQEPRPPVETVATGTWEGEAPASTMSTPPQTQSAPFKPSLLRTFTPINYPMLAIAAWICGALLMAALQLLRWQRFTTQTSVSANTPAWLQQDADAVASELGCRAVSVAVCKRLSTPAVAGVFRPSILVPEALLERLPRERWHALLAHELAHIKRRDTWWRALELACGIVWFWNPVFWFARKHARTAAEHACDAWVVWAMPDERRAYADALVDVSEWASSPTLPATAIGMSAANRAKLEARLTSIVAGKIARRTSRTMRIAAALLLAASLPGWAIQEKNTEQESKPTESPAKNSAESTRSIESSPMHVAQAEAKIKPANKSRTERAAEEFKQKLDEPVSIEFEDEHVQTILQFLSGYVGINIVLDHSVISEERDEKLAEMDVVHIGPFWYRHPRREHMEHINSNTFWSPSQVVDGMVGPFKGQARSAREVLDELIVGSGMTYAITPECILVTVAEPQFEFHDEAHQAEKWIWHPLSQRSFIGQDEAVSKNLSAFHVPIENPDPLDKVHFQIDRQHIANVVEKLHDSFSTRTVNGRQATSTLPPIVVDALAIAPPPEGSIPKTYLIPNDSKRISELSHHWLDPASHAYNKDKLERRSIHNYTGADGQKPSPPVTSGIVPFIKLQDVPLNGALTALLRPLNLAHVAGPGFTYISSPERLAAVEFTDSPVPANQDELGKALDAEVTIEFDDEHVNTILEFISGYVGINIVLDSRAVVPENLESHSDIGTKPVTDGHVPYVHVNDLRLADTLKALLTPLDLDYSVGPGYIWVSSPEFIGAETKTASASPIIEEAAAVAAPMPEPKPAPSPVTATVESRPATVQPPKAPTVAGYEFRRITRWEDSRDPRVGVVYGGKLEWYEIGQSAGPLKIEDIDVISNQVVVNSGGQLRVLQLAWPVEESATPAPRRKRAARTTSRWTWTPIPYGGVKFGAIARWEDSRDARVQVEFPNGQRKWLEAGAAIGNARIGAINILSNQVIVRTPEGESRTFDLPRPTQVPAATAPRAKRPQKQPRQRTWTPVDVGNITFGRIARWEDSRDPRVEIELPNGERKWLEKGQSNAGVTIVDIDILKNRVTLKRNGATEVVQLP